jgi:hypothetical protein
VGSSEGISFQCGDISFRVPIKPPMSFWPTLRPDSLVPASLLGLYQRWSNSQRYDPDMVTTDPTDPILHVV